MLKQLLSPRELLSIIPVAVISEPYQTNFSAAMADYSIWGQTAMMIQKLQQYSDHCRAQSMGLAAKSQLVDKAIKRLKKSRDDYAKMRQSLLDLNKAVGVKEVIKSGLMSEIAVFKQDETLVAAVEAVEQQMQGETNAFSIDTSLGRPHRDNAIPASTRDSSLHKATSAVASPEAFDVDTSSDSDSDDSESGSDDDVKDSAVKDVLGI
jgi:hypothetical protein